MNIIIKLSLVILILTGCSQRELNPSNKSMSYKKELNIKTPKSKEKSENSSSFFSKKKIDSPTIAIVFPSHTIGKYALEATNSINTYLLNKNEPFKLNVYDIIIQNRKNLINVIEKIKAEKITRVVAMITKDDLTYLTDISDIEDIKFYLPLINKYDVKSLDKITNLNLTFGAISYKKQFKRLVEYSNGKPLVELYGNSGIGRTLHKYLQGQKLRYSKKIDDNNGRYKVFLENNKRLDNSVVFLNTPIVKSSILLSAINSQELLISKIFSTQLNYTPLLFSLTQERDRKKLVIANSIGKIPKELEEYNNLIGNNLSYSWVNYSTIIGVEYLLNGNIDMFTDLELKNNQVDYPVRLYSVQKHSFKLIK